MRGVPTHYIDSATRIDGDSETDLVIGLGGSATNDGGAGLLDELGVRFVDGADTELEPVPTELERCAAIDLTTLEGKDTPGKVRALCAKAVRPDPTDASVPHTAAV